MKKNKIGNLCYKEVTTLNEKGEVVKTIAYDPNDYRYKDPGYNHNYYSWVSDASSFNGTTITSTSSGDYSNPVPYDPTTWAKIDPSVYSDYLSESSKEIKREKEITRSEQMAIARMNTLKEILDDFDTCETFEEVYKVIAKFQNEYDKLAGEDEK